MFKLRGFNKFVLAINILAVIFLCGSYAAMNVSPEKFYPLAFLGLFYPAILLVNVLFIIYWVFLFRIYFFVSFLGIVAGISVDNSLVQLKPWREKVSEKKIAKDSLVKFASYNVRLFDLYNWSKNKNTRDSILNFVQKLNTDIISFQEFYSDEKEKFIDLESLKKIFKTPYCHTYYTVTLRKTDHWGMATFSKFPIVNVGAINFLTSSNNACMFSDIKIGKDTIRVYNIHFQSIHFKKEDYAFMDSLKSENEKPKQNIKNSRRILSRLKKAFIKRAVQVDTVASHIAQSPYPVIVSGDFNDSPVSYTYKKISKNLDDAFMKSGFGLGQTYNGKFPSLRIDYILHSKVFDSFNFNTHRKNFSDHFALSFYFKKSNNNIF